MIADTLNVGEHRMMDRDRDGSCLVLFRSGGFLFLSSSCTFKAHVIVHRVDIVVSSLFIMFDYSTLHQGHAHEYSHRSSWEQVIQYFT